MYEQTCDLRVCRTRRKTRVHVNGFFETFGSRILLYIVIILCYYIFELNWKTETETRRPKTHVSSPDVLVISSTKLYFTYAKYSDTSIFWYIRFFSGNPIRKKKKTKNLTSICAQTGASRSIIFYITYYKMNIYMYIGVRWRQWRWRVDSVAVNCVCRRVAWNRTGDDDGDDVITRRIGYRKKTQPTTDV